VYYSFFGLTREPFSMSPDPSMLYMTYQHRECIAGLLYSVVRGKGLIVLSGDVGSGKTTALAKLGLMLPATIRVASIFHTTLNTADFWALLLLEFGLNSRKSSKAERLTMLRQFLLSERARGVTPALIVDEAHKLSVEVLEELRLLSNLEKDNQKLLTIVLAGQLELSDILRRDDMRQFKQRIAVRLSIQAMQPEDVRPYIQHRWNCAGANQTHPFTNDAVESVIRYSGCVPRLVNSICDNALLLTFAASSRVVEEKHVREAAIDLDLTNTSFNRKPANGRQIPAASSATVPQNGAQPAEKPGPDFQAVIPSVRSAAVNGDVREKKQSFLNRLGIKAANG
jgi:general secretion pathway protein A